MVACRGARHSRGPGVLLRGCRHAENLLPEQREEGVVVNESRRRKSSLYGEQQQEYNVRLKSRRTGAGRCGRTRIALQ